MTHQIRVEWYDHDCEWVSKYCHEHHTRTASLPVELLNDPDTWLAQIRADAAAEALEAAADHLPAHLMTSHLVPLVDRVDQDWLRVRAAEIRKGTA